MDKYFFTRQKSLKVYKNKFKNGFIVINLRRTDNTCANLGYLLLKV